MGVLVATVALFVLPTLADLAFSGTAAPFRYSAPDAFYYHTIARNFAQTGVFSYDGIHDTNGFHPAWQLILGGLYWLAELGGVSELGYLYTSLGLGTLVVAMSIALIGGGLVRSGRWLPPSFLLLPLGAYAFLLAPYWILAVDVHRLEHWSQGPFPLFGTLWSYVNGMESGIVLFSWAALAHAFISPTTKPILRASKLGLLAAVLCLARLDHGLLGLPLVAHFAIRAMRRRTRSSGRELFAFISCFALPIFAFLMLSQVGAGAALPVSGSAKTTFPIPNTGNFTNLFEVAKEPLADARSVSALYRSTQLLVPAGAAVIVLLLARRRRSADHPPDPWTTFLELTAAGVLLLASYDFLFVKTFAMGHWYVPISTLFVSLCVVAPPGIAVPVRSRRPWIWPALAALCLLAFGFLHRRPDHHWLYAQMYLVEGPEARAFYGSSPPKLLEVDDGILAFSTGFPSMSGTGLALDVEAAHARQVGRLLPLALDRDFDRSSSLVYGLPLGVSARGRVAPGEEGARAHINRFLDTRRGYAFETEYISSSGYFWIVRNLGPRTSQGQ